MLSNMRNVLKCYSMALQTRTVTTGGYNYIDVGLRGQHNNIGLIALNRPKALNALCNGLMTEVNKAMNELQADKTIGAIVLTGSEKVFAAGADIKEMVDKRFDEVFYWNDLLGEWLNNSVKPVIAAVNGLALGGGCELALMCDIVYAGENARFGQPEILIGLIPGAGGTQRLTKTIGKSRTMEMVLTGKQISATEAQSWGIVNKLFPTDKVVDEAIKLGEKIASNSKLITAMCKVSVNNALETTLDQGLKSERRLNHMTFGTYDKTEGMKAFIEKRAPKFRDQ